MQFRKVFEKAVLNFLATSLVLSLDEYSTPFFNEKINSVSFCISSIIWHKC